MSGNTNLKIEGKEIHELPSLNKLSRDDVLVLQSYLKSGSYKTYKVTAKDVLNYIINHYNPEIESNLQYYLAQFEQILAQTQNILEEVEEVRDELLDEDGNIVVNEVQILSGTEAEIAAKNSGSDPMTPLKEPVFITDTEQFGFRREDGSMVWIGGGSGGSGEFVVAKTLFVDATLGNDSTGTRERADLPYATIYAAVAASSNGDTIRIRAGTYEPSPSSATPLNITNSLILHFERGARLIPELTPNPLITWTPSAAYNYGGYLLITADSSSYQNVRGDNLNDTTVITSNFGGVGRLLDIVTPNAPTGLAYTPRCIIDVGNRSISGEITVGNYGDLTVKCGDWYGARIKHSPTSDATIAEGRPNHFDVEVSGTMTALSSHNVIFDLGGSFFGGYGARCTLKCKARKVVLNDNQILYIRKIAQFIDAAENHTMNGRMLVDLDFGSISGGGYSSGGTGILLIAPPKLGDATDLKFKFKLGRVDIKDTFFRYDVWDYTEDILGNTHEVLIYDTDFVISDDYTRELYEEDPNPTRHAGFVAGYDLDEMKIYFQNVTANFSPYVRPMMIGEIQVDDQQLGDFD